MATNKKVLTAAAAKKAIAAKRAAATASVGPRGAGTTATTKAPSGPAAGQQAAPQAPLFVIGILPPVLAGSHRAYAQACMRQLAKQQPKGFTLAQLKALLIASAAGSSIAPPIHGWAAHNMPTWAAHPKQSWLVRAN